MSFYQMMRDRLPKLNEADTAKRLSLKVSTLRSWRICEPKAIFIHEVAVQLGVDPGDLFKEYIEDYKSEHAQPAQKCSNG